MGTKAGRPRKATKRIGLAVQKRLRRLMVDKKWKRQDLADASGVGSAAVTGWLHSYNPRLPDATSLRTLAKSSGYSLDWLLLGPPAPELRGDIAPIDDLATALRTHVVLRLRASRATSKAELDLLPSETAMLELVLRATETQVAEVRRAVGRALRRKASP